MILLSILKNEVYEKQQYNYKLKINATWVFLLCPNSLSSRPFYTKPHRIVGASYPIIVSDEKYKIHLLYIYI